MTDYAATATALRVCADKDKGCDDCPYMAKCLTNKSGKHVAMTDAADAIEELLPYKSVVEKGQGLLEKAQELLDALRPRWISVKERLPEKYVPVLVYSPTGIMVDSYIGVYDGKDYFGMNTYHVTHWIPLPAPPKEENKCND